MAVMKNGAGFAEFRPWQGGCHALALRRTEAVVSQDWAVAVLNWDTGDTELDS